jgi:hypothetical protein
MVAAATARRSRAANRGKTGGKRRSADMSDGPVVRIASSPDGIELYVLVDGKRIAKRGQPGTPQAGTWISLEPGWEVVSGKDHKTIGIRYNGVTIH